MVSRSLLPLFEAVRAAGGRALLVGGSVRDSLLGNPSKDADIEVHGLTLDALNHSLARWGPPNEVGRSFGVLKFRIAGQEVDVSLPRRDSRTGPGHRGILATADPALGIVEAARRRDLTINAIAYDPLTDTLEDPFDGRGDLDRRLLRAVDTTTFGEDPLRALRVAQFAARLPFSVDPDLERLCVDMPLHELPAERIRGEIEKLLLKGSPPSRGWAFAERAGIWQRVVPEWGPVAPSLDRVAKLPVSPAPRRLALLLAAASEGLDDDAVVRVLDRLWIHRVEGVRVREQVRFLVRAAPVAAGWDDRELRQAADEGDLTLLAALVPGIAHRVRTLGLDAGPLPELLNGRDLGAFGIGPGPAMGRTLRAVRDAQLAGEVATSDEARAWLDARLRNGEAP